MKLNRYHPGRTVLLLLVKIYQKMKENPNDDGYHVIYYMIVELRGVEPLSDDTTNYYSLRCFAVFRDISLWLSLYGTCSPPISIWLVKIFTRIHHSVPLYISLRRTLNMQVFEPQQLHASILLCFGNCTRQPLQLVCLRLILWLTIT